MYTSNLTLDYSVPFSVSYTIVQEENNDVSIPTQIFKNCDFSQQLNTLPPLPLPSLQLLLPPPPIEPMHTPVLPTHPFMYSLPTVPSHLIPERVALTSFLQRFINQAAQENNSKSDLIKDFEVVSLSTGRKIRVLLVNQDYWVENTVKLTFIAKDTIDWKTFYNNSVKIDERIRFHPEVELKLKEWIKSHPVLYPTDTEKKHLMEQTGLDFRQITNWVCNTRKKGAAEKKYRITSSPEKPLFDGLEIMHVLSQKKINSKFFGAVKYTDNKVQFYTPMESWALFTSSIGVDFHFVEDTVVERFNVAQSQSLIGWYASHQEHPYPTMEEKIVLTQQSGLTMSQLNTWFCNIRKKKQKQIKNYRKPEEI